MSTATTIERKKTTTAPHKSAAVKVAFSAAVLIFCLANVALTSFSKLYEPTIESAVMEPGADTNNHTKTWSWWLARKWMEEKQAPDVVLFGSSQMGSALCAADAQQLFQVIDSLTHRHASTMEIYLSKMLNHPVSVFSLASPGAMCSDAFMASKALFDKKHTPKVVVLSLAPRDFIDNTMPYPAVTEPFKFYSHYVNPGKLTAAAYLEPMSWLQLAMDSVPFRKLGNYVQTSCFVSDANSTPRQTAANNALAAVLGGGEALPNKWLVPANIPPMWVDNSKEYLRRFKDPHPPVYKSELAFFDHFLSEMHARGIKVLVVAMPSLPMNRQLLPESFWTEFRRRLSTDSAQHGAQWMDLTNDPSFAKADYLDTVHLNAGGGAKLFHKLSERINSDPNLAAALH